MPAGIQILDSRIEKAVWDPFGGKGIWADVVLVFRNNTGREIEVCSVELNLYNQQRGGRLVGNRSASIWNWSPGTDAEFRFLLPPEAHRPEVKDIVVYYKR